jgi:methyl-accepting chemotaxis protein
MNWFLNLPTRQKLFIVFGVVFAMFAVVTVFTIRSLRRAGEELQLKQANVADLASMAASLGRARTAVLMLFLAEDKAQRQRWADQIEASVGEQQRILGRLSERNRDDRALLDRIAEYRRINEPYRTTRDEVVQLALADRVAEAKAISLTQNNERYLRMSALADELIEKSRADGESAASAAEENVRTTTRAVIAASILIGLLTLITMSWLSRLVAQPLREILAAAERISKGDLRAPVSFTNRDDEVGALAKSFQTMLESLRTMHRDIQDGVHVLASSASEISAASAEIAAGATETATAVSQTTTTVEELKQTAQVSAQKANHVAEVAQQAAQAAQTGRKAVEESVAGMEQIHEQMALIGASVVRLTEQSQAIRDIISSVNDLTEQSNLLAVNASIEAAKAGEHGRGFAVVAQEIRTLATQSKEATAQVRAILNEVQKATSAAALAAEQGSKAVEKGIGQATQSGEAIRALADSIVTAAQAASQITASSQQQLVGVDQVASAIQNILQASKQNATGTQQADTGARNLNELGQRLKKVVQRFAV